MYSHHVRLSVSVPSQLESNALTFRSMNLSSAQGQGYPVQPGEGYDPQGPPPQGGDPQGQGGMYGYNQNGQGWGQQ